MTSTTTFTPPETLTVEYEAYSDKQLIDKYLGGDSSAFSALYWRHNERLMTYLITKKGLGPEDAADVLSLCWEKVLRHLHRFDPDQSQFSSWAHLIAGRLAQNHYRNVGRHPDEQVPSNRSLSAYSEQQAAGSRPLRDQLPGAEHPELRPLVNEEISEALTEALGRLSKKQKRTLLMRWETPLAYHEIAEELDRPTGTIKSRLCRSREHLREFFREEHPELIQHVKERL